MNTDEFLKHLVATLPEDSLYVSSLGRTSEAAFRYASPQRTLFLDAMGDVSTVALGMAIGAAPLPIVALDTDGSVLMNLSAIPTIATHIKRCRNFQLVILDNQGYESAGQLPRPYPLDWVALFATFGLSTILIDDPRNIPSPLPVPSSVLVASIQNLDAPPDATKTIDGVESSYIIEHRIADILDRPQRRPAVKP